MLWKSFFEIDSQSPLHKFLFLPLSRRQPIVFSFAKVQGRTEEGFFPLGIRTSPFLIFFIYLDRSLPRRMSFSFFY